MSWFLKYRIRDYPELMLFEGAEEQKRAIRKANSECGMARRGAVGGAFGGAVGGFFFGAAAVRFLPASIGQTSKILTYAIQFVVVLVLVIPIGILTSRGVRKKVEQSLRRQLVEKGIAVCIGCGYDLRGCRSGRCPECGLEFEEGDGDDSVG